MPRQRLLPRYKSQWRRAPGALGIALTFARAVSAEPAQGPPSPSSATNPASAKGPALQLAPLNQPLYSKAVGLGMIAGLYGAVYTWTYFAWYKNRATVDDIVFEDEGLFGADTYAGGSDKFGHAWGNYIINRWTANVLATGGWDRLERSLIATSTTMAFFTMIELKDGYHKGFGFSWWDMAANTVGNAAAVAMTLSPRLDEMFDFKVYYLPTRAYLRSLTQHGVVDAGEDYSGQTFVLGYHLTSIDKVKHDPSLQLLRYVDLTLGFRSRNYLPEPKSPNTPRMQEVSLGVAFNFQHLLDTLYDWYEPPRSHAHSSLRFVLEGFGVPYTNAYLLRYQKHNGPKPPDPPDPEAAIP